MTLSKVGGLSGALVVLAAAGVAALPQYDFWRAEVGLAEIYRKSRPFDYRWDGAPWAAVGGTSSAPGEIERVARRLRQLEPSWANSHRWLVLSARLSLLERRYDRAIVLYRRALLLGSNAADAEEELAVAYALRAAKDHQNAGLGLALEQIGKAIEEKNPSAAVHFNAALIFRRTSLLRLAAKEWAAASAQEEDQSWRREAAGASRDLQKFFSDRSARIGRLNDPSSIDDAALAWPGAVELVQSTAMRQWIGQASLHRAALKRIASAFETRHGDRWWQDFLGAPATPHVLEALQGAYNSNADGKRAEAGARAMEAEQEFGRLGNPAGRLMARLIRINASERGDGPGECLTLLPGIEEETERRSYRWLQATFWIDSTTCRNVLLKPDREHREAILERVRGTGFEALTLRATASLTEPDFTGVSTASVWDHVLGGLAAYWASAIPEYRVHHFCWCLAEAERIANRPRSAVVAMQESVADILDERDTGLVAEIRAQLGGYEARAGLQSAAMHDLATAYNDLDKGRSAMRPERDRIRIDIELAGANIENGHPEAAAETLGKLRDVESRDQDQIQRAQINGLFGLTALRSGDYTGALASFRTVVEVYRPVVSSDWRRRSDSVAMRYQSAFRGRVEALIRSGEVEAALKSWRALQSPWPLDESRLSTNVDSGNARLTFAILPGGVSAWMTDERGVEQRWVAAAPVIDSAGRLIGLASDSGTPMEAINRAARELYDLLIAPFAPRLMQLAKVASDPLLVIEADEKFAGIPWSVLENPKGEPLIARYSIVSAPRSPQEHRESTITRSVRAAVLADPDLGEKTHEFPPLTDALEEGTSVAAHFQRASFLTGARASSGAFLDYAEHVNVLHFAGHGVANGGVGGLLLAGEPGVVDAGQISRLNLRGLDLAVLAACSTGPGSETPWAAADTLVRGFLDAGAARVLAANWDVESAATRHLMEHFYDELLAGKTPATALRSAMLALRARPATAHPSAWAAFQLYGQP